jgi:hypothetical protein
MLDPDYFERIEREMRESGGVIAADDHEPIWELLNWLSDYVDQLEFSISVLTRRPLDKVLEMAANAAATRNPALSKEEALQVESRRRRRPSIF